MYAIIGVHNEFRILNVNVSDSYHIHLCHPKLLLLCEKSINVFANIVQL